MTTLDTAMTAEHDSCAAGTWLRREASGSFFPGQDRPVRITDASSAGRRVPVLAVAGGTASGKSTLAEAFVLHRPGAVALIHLDDFYVPAHDPQRGMRTLSATGAETLDWNHPGSIDEDAAAAAVDAAAASGRYRLVVVEGLFALALAKIADQATWGIYVDAPDDVRLARKLLRKIEIQRQDPAISLRNYLNSGRERHTDFVAPSRARADLVLDGMMATADLLTAVDNLVGPLLAPAR